jgi:copper chaperone
LELPDERKRLMSVTATYTVTGMTCGHCVSSVKEELSEVAGVTGVDVVLDTGAVTVTSDRELGRDEVVAAVTEAGYQVS